MPPLFEQIFLPVYVGTVYIHIPISDTGELLGYGLPAPALYPNVWNIPVVKLRTRPVPHYFAGFDTETRIRIRQQVNKKNETLGHMYN